RVTPSNNGDFSFQLAAALVAGGFIPGGRVQVTFTSGLFQVRLGQGGGGVIAAWVALIVRDGLVLADPVLVLLVLLLLQVALLFHCLTRCHDGSLDRQRMEQGAAALERAPRPPGAWLRLSVAGPG